jgi:hypothetical protein
MREKYSTQDEGWARIINIRDIKIDDEESRSSGSFKTDSPIPTPPPSPKISEP